MWSDVLVAFISLVAGAVAAVTGFGIGSLLTPLLALQVDTRVAVAAVSIPHLIGTAVRFWLLQGEVDRRVLSRFGLASAAGGLVGAVLQGWASGRWLSATFGFLLIFAAASEVAGLTRRMHLRGWVAWLAGACSGFLGGLVGNQGGIRSAALLGFDLSRQTFVATATAVALLVDCARVPVYLVTQYDEATDLVSWMAVATVGVTVGTILGNRVLVRIPDVWFRLVLVVVLVSLGGAMLVRAARQ